MTNASLDCRRCRTSAAELYAELSLRVGAGADRKGGISWGIEAFTSPLKERYPVSQDNLLKLIQLGRIEPGLIPPLRRPIDERAGGLAAQFQWLFASSINAPTGTLFNALMDNTLN